jgi:hypothetical protein
MIGILVFMWRRREPDDVAQIIAPDDIEQMPEPLERDMSTSTMNISSTATNYTIIPEACDMEDHLSRNYFFVSRSI